MGLCLCKDSSDKTCCGCNSSACPCCFRWGKIRGGSNGNAGILQNHNHHHGSSGSRGDTLGSDNSAASDPNFLITHLTPHLIDTYVLETLKILRTLVGKYDLYKADINSCCFSLNQ